MEKLEGGSSMETVRQSSLMSLVSGISSLNELQ